jgi:hypothetical protein
MSPSPYLLVRFRRFDRVAQRVARDQEHAKALIDTYESKGWEHVSTYETTTHKTKITRNIPLGDPRNKHGNTKYTWGWTCTCGDSDHTNLKADITRMARDHETGREWLP